MELKFELIQFLFSFGFEHFYFGLSKGLILIFCGIFASPYLCWNNMAIYLSQKGVVTSSEEKCQNK
jgi:hypothetical protein